MSESLPFGMERIDPALAGWLRGALAEVETALRAAVESDYPLVTDVSRHLVDAGGKRFRPLLTLVGATYGDRSARGVVPGAVVNELTHLATLYHDDVMDEAPLRRGAESANQRWGNTVAILTGDFLFARAADIGADLGAEVVRLQARTFERLVIGQIAETAGPKPGQDPVDHHLAVLADKTGSLIATSGRMGALTSGAGPVIAAAMAAYGEHIGLAFQLSDDLLDIESESEESGKTPGTDLREGVHTLPVLLALADDDPAHARLRALLAGPLTDDTLHAEALALLRAHPAMDRARDQVRRWADQARSELEAMPAGASTDALALLCDVVAQRRS